MPGQRNPLTEGTRYVTQRATFGTLTGGTTYSTGGDTWTFNEVRNIRRIESIVHDITSLGAGEILYRPVVLVNDGQGNSRTVQLVQLLIDTPVTNPAVESEVTNGTTLTTVPFIAVLELAEGP